MLLLKHVRLFQQACQNHRLIICSNRLPCSGSQLAYVLFIFGYLLLIRTAGQSVMLFSWIKISNVNPSWPHCVFGDTSSVSYCAFRLCFIYKHIIEVFVFPLYAILFIYFSSVLLFLTTPPHLFFIQKKRILSLWKNLALSFVCKMSENCEKCSKSWR